MYIVTYTGYTWEKKEEEVMCIVTYTGYNKYRITYTGYNNNYRVT